MPLNPIRRRRNQSLRSLWHRTPVASPSPLPRSTPLRHGASSPPPVRPRGSWRRTSGVSHHRVCSVLGLRAPPGDRRHTPFVVAGFALIPIAIGSWHSPRLRGGAVAVVFLVACPYWVAARRKALTGMFHVHGAPGIFGGTPRPITRFEDPCIAHRPCRSAAAGACSACCLRRSNTRRHRLPRPPLIHVPPAQHRSPRATPTWCSRERRAVLDGWSAPPAG